MCIRDREYTVEQLNHGRKVYDFMRWDYWAFGISGLLLIAAIVIMGVRGFNWEWGDQYFPNFVFFSFFRNP